ncbi:MAG: imidazole glycerol phosphate synthase subunit HisH [bacterium]|nr:imidazole glycerol phosphate synthase subunit HisH [bacterium]
MNEIVIVDYGVGNVLSVQRAFAYVGAAAVITDSLDAIRSAKALVLPGVGAFGNAMAELEKRNLIDSIKEFAKSGRPFLGICLGMQMMMDGSEEFGFHKGLGFISGNVVKIADKDVDGNFHKIPHVGWNSIKDATGKDTFEEGILRGIKQGSSFYFVHSYTPVPVHEEERIADTSYGGIRIAAVIRKGNLYGCQFHPEKSGPKGLALLKNFVDLAS